MTSDRKFLIYALVLSGAFGTIALMLDQYAIQQESGIRYTQIEANESQSNSIMMKNFSATSSAAETSGLRLYKSIQARYLILYDYELSFLNENIPGQVETCQNKANSPPCLNNEDNIDHINEDLLRFISIITSNIKSEFEFLTSRIGELEGAKVYMENFLNNMDKLEQAILKSDYPDAVFNNDEIFNTGLKNLGDLRMLVVEESKQTDLETFDLKVEVSEAMSFRQKLLLSAVFFQIASLMCLLYFFRKFLYFI